MTEREPQSMGPIIDAEPYTPQQVQFAVQLDRVCQITASGSQILERKGIPFDLKMREPNGAVRYHPIDSGVLSGFRRIIFNRIEALTEEGKGPAAWDIYRRHFPKPQEQGGGKDGK